MGLFGPDVETMRRKKDVPGLVKALKDPDKRDASLRALQRVGDERAVPEVLRIFQTESDDTVRSLCLAVLSAIGAKSAGPALIRELERMKPADSGSKGDVMDIMGMRKTIIGILVRIGDEESVQALFNILQGEAKREGFLVYMELNDAPNKAALLPLLSRRLRDSNIKVKRAALGMMSCLKEPRAAELAAPYLEAEDEDLRIAATSLLVALKDKRAAAPLLQMLGSPNDQTRKLALGDLAELGDERVIGPLIKEATAGPKKDRLPALRLLGDFKDPRAVETLLAAMEDDDKHVRWCAAVALGKTGDARAVPLARRMLGHRDGLERLMAVHLLGKVGGKAAAGALEKALRDELVFTRVEAAKALGALGERGAVPALVELLQDPYVAVREAAITALGMLGDPRAVEPLARKLTISSKNELLNLKQVYDELKGVPKEDSRILKDLMHFRPTLGPLGGAAALALAKIGDRGAVAPLMKVLKGGFMEGRDDNVAAYSALALAKMRVSEAVAPTIELLKGNDDDVLYLACLALGEQGDVRARAALEELRDDKLEVLFYDLEKEDYITTTVGEAARAALARIGGASGPR